MTAVSIFLYAKLDIGGSGLNSHRFVTAAFFLSPLMGAYWIASECRRLGVTRGAGSLVSVLVYLAIGLASATTVEWVRGIAERVCWERKGFFGVDPFYETDCRTEARARLFQKTVPTYIDESIWYLYSGCRPVFAPGPPAGQDGLAVKVGIP